MRLAGVLPIALLWFAPGELSGQATGIPPEPGSRVRLDLVERLELSRGTRSHWQTGAAIGFVAGAGITFLVLRAGGSTALCNRSANQDALRAEECLGLVALGGVVGAGLGAIVGGLIRTDRRETVSLDRVRLGAGRDGRLTLGLALPF